MQGPNEKRPVDECKESSNDNERPYYYDDAHGYENYDPDSEPVDDEDDRSDD